MAGNKLISILRLKCPRCHKGDLFLNKNPYNPWTIDKMPHYCPECGEDLQREVGFYYGAMMISHASTTVIGVIVHVTLFQFYGWEIMPNLITLLTVLLVLMPVIFRTSRAIWINIFSKYDPDAIKNKIVRWSTSIKVRSQIDDKNHMLKWYGSMQNCAPCFSFVLSNIRHHMKAIRSLLGTILAIVFLNAFGGIFTECLAQRVFQQNG